MLKDLILPGSGVQISIFFSLTSDTSRNKLISVKKGLLHIN